MPADDLVALLDAPPPRVRVQHSLDGIHIQLPPPLRPGAALPIFGWLGALLLPPLATFVLLAELAAQNSAVPIGLAPIAAFLVLLPGGFLALPRLIRALQTPSAMVQVLLGPHELRLGEIRMPFAELARVSPDTAEPSIFTEDGSQYAILADHPEAVRRWLTRVLREVHTTRRGGTAQDVPQILQRLQGRTTEAR